MDDRRPRRAALHVALAALLLAAAKAAAGLLTGSVAVLSSALDSAADALASFANFLFLTVASKPPDEDHPFGHGKAEHLAALLQGAILLAGAIYLGVNAAERIRRPEPVESNMAGVVTMIASIVVTIGITAYLKKHAARSESAALSGDALHYTSDIVANLATIIALVLVRVTGNPLFDSIFGVMVAGWIAWSSAYLIWNAGNDLMDVALPEQEVAAVIEAIERADPSVTGYRELRTRRAAGVRFIEFELLIERKVSFEHAHDVTEKVKAAIHDRFERSVVTVHAEPV
ncbi:MAG TPA: cation diffusion facilitator family transporter [Thermoanaerobaculia bacterium]|jgi:ferrous-iron efflux pump FieF|nr:cation diffusion facilitator family transporter [Thermoanaerobaculia bacterium]